MATRFPLRALYPHLAGHAARWWFGIVALLCAHVIEIGVPHFLQVGLDRLARGQLDVTLPVLSILVLTVLRYACTAWGRRTNAQVSVQLARSLRASLYGPLQQQRLDFWRQHTVGDMMSRMTADVDAVRRFFRFAFNQIVSLLAITAVAPWFLVSLSPAITLWVAPLFGVIIAGAFAFAVKLRAGAARVQSLAGSLQQAVLSDLQGIRTLQASAREDLAVRRVAEISQVHAQAQDELNRWQSRMNAFMQGTAATMSLVALWQGGQQVLAGQMTVGALGAFLFYLGMVVGVYSRCVAPVYAFLAANSAAARLQPLLSAEEPLKDSPAGIGAVTPHTGAGLVLHHLSFSYGGREDAPVLNDISLTVHPGETLVVMGPVGSGKSTLLRLLVRQLEATQGRIELDGQDTRTLSLHRLREHITLVTQDSHLFSTTVAENIAFDDPERPPESIWHSARLAALARTIEGFPQGMATRVGERGVRLSGGQKQRTLLARALIRQPPVLLLDDTFSALDTQTEAQVLDALRQARHGMTTLISSHRSSTAERADRVVLLDRGRIVDIGPHDDLLQRQPLYRRLCSHAEADAREVA